MMNERRNGNDRAAMQRSGTQDPPPRKIVPNANLAGTLARSFSILANFRRKRNAT